MPIASERAEVGSLTMLLTRISAITVLPITAARRKSRGSVVLDDDLVSGAGGPGIGGATSSDPDGARRSTLVISAGRGSLAGPASIRCECERGRLVDVAVEIDPTAPASGESAPLPQHARPRGGLIGGLELDDALDRHPTAQPRCGRCSNRPRSAPQVAPPHPAGSAGARSGTRGPAGPSRTPNTETASTALPSPPAPDCHATARNSRHKTPRSHTDTAAPYPDASATLSRDPQEIITAARRDAHSALRQAQGT